MIVTTYSITAPQTSYLALAVKYGWREVIETLEVVNADESVTVTTIPTGLDSNKETYITYIQRYVQEQVLANWLGQEILFFQRAKILEIDAMKKQVESAAIQAASSMVSQVV